MSSKPLDPGVGPPKGSWMDTPGPAYSVEDLAKNAASQLGTVAIQTDDPGFMPPHDPLNVGDTKARAKLVYRDIPLVQVQNTWSVAQARQALYSHMIGLFDQSGQLVDSILGDDRVMATTGSRVTGLFGREVRFKPANDSKAAKEAMDVWQDHWPRMSGTYALHEAHVYAIHMGWSASQLNWDISGKYDLPYLRFWHPRYSYYHWQLRRYIALSQDGQIAIVPGNGKWLLHVPRGEYRGWIHGAIRAVTEPWLLRHFAFRDMARFSEVHGLPTRVGMVPAASDPTERSNFEQSIASLGSEPSMILPTGVDGVNGYDYKLIEARDTAWESFPGLIDRCDMAIVLAIMFQNLTTEVQGGAFAATKAHMDIRQGGIQFDNAAWKNTIYNQIARPFAYMNFGDPDLAPWTEWDVTPLDQVDAKAKRLQMFLTGIEVGRRGGWEFKDEEAARAWAAKQFGLDELPEFKITDPVSSGMGGQSKSKLPFTDVDPAQVVKVNEAREMNGLPPMPGGDVTIAEYHAAKGSALKKDETESAEKSKADHAPPPAPHQEPDGDEGDGNEKEAAE